MAKELDEQAFELSALPPEGLFEPTDAARSCNETSDCEFAPNSQPGIWCTDQPQYCKDVAARYGKIARTVQQTYHKIASRLPWVSEADLKLPDSRYTPLCIELMGDYWNSGLMMDAWQIDVMQRYPDRVAAHIHKTQSQQPVAQPAPNSSQEQPEEPIEGILEDPAPLAELGEAPIVLSLDYLQNPTRMRQQLEDMYALQRQTVANLQTTAAELQHNAQQFSEAINLHDQLLIQRAVREGTELGITLARVREEACRAAQHAVQTHMAQGAAAEPGKPQDDQPAIG